MALKDWKKIELRRTLIKYKHKLSGDIIFAIPTIRDRINGKWDLHLPDERIIDYRGKREVKRDRKSVV